MDFLHREKVSNLNSVGSDADVSNTLLAPLPGVGGADLLHHQLFVEGFLLLFKMS